MDSKPEDWTPGPTVVVSGSFLLSGDIPAEPVWILREYHDDEPDTIIGVFSTEDRARQHMRQDMAKRGLVEKDEWRYPLSSHIIDEAPDDESLIAMTAKREGVLV